MQFEQRMYARLRFLDLMADLHGSAFEDFFHKLMCAGDPDFLDVRTHGNLGDSTSPLPYSPTDTAAGRTSSSTTATCTTGWTTGSWPQLSS